ncbi:hypothetical protein N7481_008751 [Penicillium waksmanii]|uniref:uncharacterized protein n=1 Tax=Penicillium waksmanii TaxID=69791 RepID=UPI002547CAF9|nr:uncharacterized protein N7481_008751 [Penicillium waksmanii]KAJ5975044.1 hypothetical protein N7481_008751 [Penicillium waksmanii]
MLATATCYHPPALQWLIREFGSTVPPSEIVLVATIAGSLRSLDWILREHLPEIGLHRLWKAIWRFDGRRVGLSIDSPHHGNVQEIRRSAAANLIKHTTDVVYVSKEGPEQASTVVEEVRLPSRDFLMSNAFEDLIIFCLGHGLTMPMTERMKKLVMDRSEADRMDLLIQYYFLEDIKVNECAAEEKLISFLTERMDKG